MRKKIEIIRRLASGETVCKVADSMGISRQYVSAINRNQIIQQECLKIEKEWEKINEEKRKLSELHKSYEAAIRLYMKKENKKVEDAGFSQRTIHALRRNGIDTIAELDYLEWYQLKRLRGVGENILEEIMEERKKRVGS